MPMNIIWFRQDLRLKDNPALNYAARSNANVLPIYILDDENAKSWKIGSAGRWWLHQSLESLDDAIDGNLKLFCGKANEILKHLTGSINIDGVYWNRCYEPWRIDRDKQIKLELQEMGIDVKSFNASLLFEPPKIKKSDGTPYKVFTPFYRKGCCLLYTSPSPRDRTRSRMPSSA